MHMNCNEARRMITAYVKKELSEKELEAFLHHIAHCSDCMDELDTYYTVYQALDLLDSGDHHDYDFRRMLSDDIRASWRRLRRRRVLGAVGGILLVLTECLLIGSAYTGYELKQGQTEYTTIQRALLRMRSQGIFSEDQELPARYGRSGWNVIRRQSLRCRIQNRMASRSVQDRSRFSENRGVARKVSAGQDCDTAQKTQAGNEVVERIRYYARKDRFDRWTQHFKPRLLRDS